MKTFREIIWRYRIDAFWDTDLESIDPLLHREFVIERLLQYGGLEGVRWIMENWGADAVKSVVMKSRSISRMTATFWSVYFDIPPKDIRCLSEPTLSPLK